MNLSPDFPGFVWVLIKAGMCLGAADCGGKIPKLIIPLIRQHHLLGVSVMELLNSRFPWQEESRNPAGSRTVAETALQ